MEIRVKHKKGKHLPTFLSLVKVFMLSLFKPDFITLIFTEDSKYDLGTNDNSDWSKVMGRGGIAYGKDGGQGYPTRKNEQFIVWRYIPEKNEFHVANDYKRVNHKMILPRFWHILKPNGKVTVSTKELKSIIPIGAYFGGNMPAPNDLTYKIKW